MASDNLVLRRAEAFQVKTDRLNQALNEHRLPWLRTVIGADGVERVCRIDPGATPHPGRPATAGELAVGRHFTSVEDWRESRRDS